MMILEFSDRSFHFISIQAEFFEEQKMLGLSKIEAQMKQHHSWFKKKYKFKNILTVFYIQLTTWKRYTFLLEIDGRKMKANEWQSWRIWYNFSLRPIFIWNRWS